MQTAQSRWNARNREKMLALNRAWYARNREANIARVKKYKSANRERATQTQLARQRKMGAISLATLEEVYTYYGRGCAYCGKPSSGVDHLQPVSRGGTNIAFNLAPCCRKCNSRKYNLPIWVMLEAA